MSELNSTMALYDILILGCDGDHIGDRLEAAIRVIVEDSGIDEGAVDLRRVSAGYIDIWNGKRPVVVACFSKPSQDDLILLRSLSEDRVPIIPIARLGERFEDFPDILKPLNGTTIKEDDPDLVAIGTTVLDAIGLLREKRRVFVSYRRTEARDIAVQLHDDLTGKGFNVFLDTHAIRPGKVFQDELWQHLCDSDVVIMLDTPGYFESKWTREEFGRAQAFGVHLLRLVWPGHKPQAETSLSQTRYLETADLEGKLLCKNALNEILISVEQLRARGIAARHLAISGKLQSEVNGIGGRVVGAGAYRAISVELKDGTQAWIYPVVGVPTAPLMNNIARRASAANHKGPFLVYDHMGIADPWLEHLEWLDRHIPEVDFMRVSNAGEVLLGRVSRS